MTHDEIRLRINTKPQMAAAAMTRAVGQAPGRQKRSAVMGGLVAICAMVLGGGGAAMIGFTFAQAWPVIVLTLVGTVLGFILAMRINYPALYRIQSEDWRWQGADIALTPEGLRLEAQLIPWDVGHGTSRMPGGTVLHLGVIDRLVIPDADLPPNLTPEDLAAYVQRWRSPCAPF